VAPPREDRAGRRRARIGGLLAALALAAGCGGPSLSPEEVVRGWSDAINHDLDEDAAAFFAPNAKVIQRGEEFTLATPDDARRFSASLPCQGKIVELSVDGDHVTATFLLDNRGTFACGGVGTTDTAIFTIADGKIAVWELVPDGVNE
jgi:hypothetical protein